MKKISIYLIVFTIICFMSDAALKHSISKELENQSPYYLSFASIGANLLESRMDGWATIKTISSYDEMDKFLINILNHLDLPADNREFHHQNDGDIIFVRYDYSDDMQHYYFLLQTNQAVNATHILITFVDEQTDERIRQVAKKLQEILDCTIYYQYRGSIDTRPDYKGQEELLKIMFTNLDADITSLYKDGNIISMTGYSSSIAQKMPAVKMDNKLSNVQAAIRTDYKQNQTSIYLGFPLLLNDY